MSQGRREELGQGEQLLNGWGGTTAPECEHPPWVQENYPCEDGG